MVSIARRWVGIGSRGQMATTTYFLVSSCYSFLDSFLLLFAPTDKFDNALSLLCSKDQLKIRGLTFPLGSQACGFCEIEEENLVHSFAKVIWKEITEWIDFKYVLESCFYSGISFASVKR